MRGSAIKACILFLQQEGTAESKLARALPPPTTCLWACQSLRVSSKELGSIPKTLSKCLNDSNPIKM